MCRPRTDPTRTALTTKAPIRIAAAAAVLGTTLLAGCSDLYLDRRDSIAFGAGDAVAANQIQQMYDPWPPHSNNVNYAANGQRMQGAVERYRTNTVTPPVSPMGLQVASPSSTTPQTNGAQNGPPSSNTTTTTAMPAGGGGFPTTSTTTVSTSGQ